MPSLQRLVSLNRFRTNTGGVADEQATELTRWTIHGERIVDDSRRARLSIAEVELPDGGQVRAVRDPRAAFGHGCGH